MITRCLTNRGFGEAIAPARTGRLGGRCLRSGLPAPDGVLVVKALLPLTARSAPNKIEKQSIANGTIDLIKSCNLHGATGDWSQRDAGPCRQVFLSWGSLKMTTNGRRHANPVALQQDGGGPEVRTVIGRPPTRVSPGFETSKERCSSGLSFCQQGNTSTDSEKHQYQRILVIHYRSCLFDYERRSSLISFTISTLYLAPT